MGKVFKEFEELCLARGREAWLAEGKDQKTEQIVTNMLRDGLPHETIARYCGTSDATITAQLSRSSGQQATPAEVLREGNQIKARWSLPSPSVKCTGSMEKNLCGIS